MTLAQPSNQLKSLHLTHSEPITQRRCYLKQLGFGTAEMLPMGAAQGQTQPPAGIKLEGGSAAGAAMPGTAFKSGIHSFYLLSLDLAPDISVLLPYISQGKKIKSEAPST